MHTVLSRLKMYRGPVLRMLLVFAVLACPAVAGAQQHEEDVCTQLASVFVCDSIASGRPLGRAAVFSAAQGRVYCYSDFVQVAEEEQITHRWLLRDSEVAQFKLTLQPPRWSAYSSLKIPEGGRGPWRVEILDQDGAVYGVARFSIVD